MHDFIAFQKAFYHFAPLDLQVDLSRSGVDAAVLDSLRPRLAKALDGIARIEAGDVMNPDEGRMVGHYWLRAPNLAPTPALHREIRDTVVAISDFAGRVHSGTLRGADGPFLHLLLVGIGGSSLGPLFVSTALSGQNDRMQLHCIDNTDPDGIDQVLGTLEPNLGQTLTLVVSKSGGTIETRNAMEEVCAFYEKSGLDFPAHAVAVTQKGSALDDIRLHGGWLAAFPMWDFVGGRTSVLSAVGLLPLALQGIDIEGLLAGAAACDTLTRLDKIEENPAALLATAWYQACSGTGGTQMVILPYKDRLFLFGKYLQQLVMESLGKALDLDGNEVHQGICVLGNKGSSDQHSYVQQLLEGPANSFTTFIEVLRDRDGPSMQVGEDSTAGDYLSAFYLGTRAAMQTHGRSSISITIRTVDAFSVGSLIALYERAVSIYALLVNVNAYHQPGVESGKKAAGEIIALKNRALAALRGCSEPQTLEQLSALLAPCDRESLFKILQHAAANPDSGLHAERAANLFLQRYFVE